MTLTSVPRITTYSLSSAWSATQSLTPMLACVSPPLQLWIVGVCSGTGCWAIISSHSIRYHPCQNKVSYVKTSPFLLPPFRMHCSDCKHKAVFYKHELVQKTRCKTKKMNITWHSVKFRTGKRETRLESEIRRCFEISIHDINIQYMRAKNADLQYFISLHSQVNYRITVTRFSSGTLKSL